MQHRLAEAADVQLYFDWANDPDTRRQSFNSEPILWEQHEAWFTRKLADPNTVLIVVETEERVPIGQVRFEKQSDGEVIIGVSLDVTFRGRGLATQLIGQGCRACRTLWGNVPILAYIKPDNSASMRAFKRAGFSTSTEKRTLGLDAICLVKS